MELIEIKWIVLYLLVLGLTFINAMFQHVGSSLRWEYYCERRWPGVWYKIILYIGIGYTAIYLGVNFLLWYSKI